MQTETIDKLFLELSQVTTAKTAREIRLERELLEVGQFASYCRSCALSGENNPQSFDEFRIEMGWTLPDTAPVPTIGLEDKQP